MIKKQRPASDSSDDAIEPVKDNINLDELEFPAEFSPFVEVMRLPPDVVEARSVGQCSSAE